MNNKIDIKKMIKNEFIIIKSSSTSKFYYKSHLIIKQSKKVKEKTNEASISELYLTKM